MRHGGPGGPQVADVGQLAAQRQVIDAQKDLAAVQFSQNVRKEKAQIAVNFILLPIQTEDGVKRQEPELDNPACVAARNAAYKFIADYFSTTTDFEDGVPVREATALEGSGPHLVQA